MSPSLLPDSRVPVLLSAHGTDLLANDARAILDYLSRPAGDVARVAAQLAGTRRVRRHRAVIRAADLGELTAGLRAVIDGAEHPLVTRSSRRTGTRTAFVFPGQGGQWPAMGADAYRHVPLYRAEADRLDTALLAGGMPSALPFLTESVDAAEVSQAQLHGAQFVHAAAVAAVWRCCGVLPDLTIGHSLGEVAAAYVAETVTLRDAVAVLAARAAAIAAVPGRNGVAVLGVDEEQARQLVATTPGWLELSAVNATRSVAVAGECAAVSAAVETVVERGQFARHLAMSFPAHTSAMDRQRDRLLAALPRGVFADSPVQFIGSATGAVVAAGTEFGSYWFANLRNTIRFDRAVRSAIDCGAGAFLEMSAHPALLFAIEDGFETHAQAGGEPIAYGSGHRDEPVGERLSANIVAAAVADPRYRWADLLTGRARPLRGLPGAPMRAERLWAHREPLPAAPTLTVTAETWRPQRTRERTGHLARPVAVLALDAADRLAAAVTAAVDDHRAAVLVEPPDAEVLVVVAPSGAAHGTAAAVADLADRIDAGLLGYADAIGEHCRDVWLVTRGAETVTAEDPPGDPCAAALAAMHRSIGFEHPDQAFGHLDLPSPPDTPNLTPGPIQNPTLKPVVIESILSGAGEIALRGDGATVYRRAVGEDAPSVAPWALDRGLLDHVVITGGSGVIGLSYARFLTAAGAKRITLLSRRGADPAVLAELRAGGTLVDAPACDVTDPGQLHRAAAAHGGDGATVVVHAAGTASFAERADVTGAALRDMAAAKITGLDHLVAGWPMRPDARMLLCSSVIGVWGGKATAGYAAANRLLDVRAAELRAAGRHCMAVRWGLWQGGGVVDTAEIARVQRAGLRPMPPVLAVAASLSDHARDPLIVAADPQRLNLLVGAAGPEDLDTGPAADDEPMTAPRAVRSQLAVVLDAEEATLDLDATLFDLGVDSLLAVDLRKRLKRLTGHTVPLATLLGGITGTDLIAAITESRPLA